MIDFMLFPSFQPQSREMPTTGTRRWGPILSSVFFALLTTSLFAFGARILFYGLPEDVASLFARSNQVAAAAASVPSPFAYDFNVRGTLEEADTPDDSSSPYWWLDSGGRLLIENAVGKTVQGALPALDTWRIHYRLSDAVDTENGYAPQNMFRLFTRSTWNDVRLTTDFRIVRDNFTESPNRDASNGLFLMSHYKDSDNLYFAGLQVDGRAVIIKKFNGAYYTMIEKQLFASASSTYERSKDMNLLPHSEWIGLRSETTTAKNGNVTVKLFMKKGNETTWTELVRAMDDGTKFGSTTPITGDFLIGIRTDFMDVEFDNFKAERI